MNTTNPMQVANNWEVKTIKNMEIVVEHMRVLQSDVRTDVKENYQKEWWLLKVEPLNAQDSWNWDVILIWLHIICKTLPKSRADSSLGNLKIQMNLGTDD